MEATVAKQLPEPQAGETAPLFGMDAEGREVAAREVAEFFRRGKEKRAATDLYRELLLVHLDGSGDGQYATLINGHISVPANPGEKLR
ncbi:MAG TPA: hypothetical protein VFW96_05925, partial [Thermomicrobiales bacterium]|nr:hypothetical protein [Thermomicrobiales bacterium]